jgi:hypothetical protein
MRKAFLLVALLGLVLLSSEVVAAPARRYFVGPEAEGVACACQPRSTPIDRATVQARIDELMRSEGMPVTIVPLVGVRAVELDGDPSTSEALVDVFAPALCFGPSCPTIVVQRSASGELVTRGRGLTLYPQDSRTGGWSDLREAAWVPTPNRTLRFAGYRYR